MATSHAATRVGKAGQRRTLNTVVACRRERAALERRLEEVNHELRTPLTKILGFVELLLDSGGQLTTGQRSLLAQIEAGSRQLARTIETVTRPSPGS